MCSQRVNRLCVCSWRVNRFSLAVTTDNVASDNIPVTCEGMVRVYTGGTFHSRGLWICSRAHLFWASGVYSHSWGEEVWGTCWLTRICGLVCVLAAFGASGLCVIVTLRDN